MSFVPDLTESQADEVDAYINSPKHRLWENELLLKWARERGGPTPLETYFAAQDEKHMAIKNAISAKRHAAQLNRTPSWADIEAIRAIYRKARDLTKSTGIEHHVDHIIPLQGRLVSGLHVENNLQILTGHENCRKNNRFEVA